MLTGSPLWDAFEAYNKAVHRFIDSPQTFQHREVFQRAETALVEFLAEYLKQQTEKN